MEPYRVITDYNDFIWLPINSIVCPIGQPSRAYRKAWSNLFTTFESPLETEEREAWQILTMHCTGDKPEVWVLWDAGAKKDALPKQGAFITVVPSRSPRRKAHIGLGYAKSAITGQLYSGSAKEDMAILQMDPSTSQYVTLHDIPKGTLKSQLPW